MTSPETFHRETSVLSKFAPVHRTTWWRWIKAGSAPKPVSLGPRTVAWRESELIAWQRGEWPPKQTGNRPNPA